MMSTFNEGVRKIAKFDNRLNIVTMGNYNLHCSDFIIRIRGLPWNTSTKEILDFFDGLNIVNGENGIHLISLATNTTKPLGEAFIELATVNDFQASQRYHKKNLRNRYIEVFESTTDEFKSVMSKQIGAQNESVVRLRGVPWNATEKDISDFFQGLRIKRNNGIHIPYFKDGKASGEAFVNFETIEDCNQALQRNMGKLGHRYIEIFRSTEQHLMRSLMESNPNPNSNANRNSRDGSHRMHPYNNGNNSFGRGKNIRGRNQNMRNDFQRDRANTGEMFMQNLNQSNNRNFGNQPFNLNNGNNQNSGNPFINDRFQQNNQNSNDNFFDDFDLSKAINNFDRPANDRQNVGNNRNYSKLLDVGNSSNTGYSNSSNDNYGNSGNSNFGNLNWSSTGSNSNSQFDFRGGGGNGNSGGGGSRGGRGSDTGCSNSFGGNNASGGNNAFGGNNSFGGSNNRFNNSKNNRNFGGGGGGSSSSGRCSTDNEHNGQHCIHMRGLPYFTDEMDVFNFFEPLKPSFCKIIINKSGLHSGEAKAYFDTYKQAQIAMTKDRLKIGNRYIELFYDGNLHSV